MKRHGITLVISALYDIAFDGAELATSSDEATQWRAASVVLKIAQHELSERNAPGLKTADSGPTMPSKRPSARFQPETREKRRPARSVVASINPVEFSHGLHGVMHQGNGDSLGNRSTP